MKRLISVLIIGLFSGCVFAQSPVSGLPSPNSVPPPIAAPVLYPSYQSQPFFHNPTLVKASVATAGAVVAIIVVHKIVNRHKNVNNGHTK